MARPSRAWRALLIGLVAQLLWLPGLAHAAPRRAVQAVVAGEPAVFQRITSLLRASLGRQGLVLSATRVSRIDPLDAVSIASEPSPDLPVAYLWLDLTVKPAILILVEAKSRLVYAQQLRVHPDPDEVETELIRFVVDQSLEAILSGSTPGVTPKEFRKSLTPQKATPAPPKPQPTLASPRRESSARTTRWAFTAGYSLDALGADALLHGPEFGLQLRLPRLQLQLRIAQRLPLGLTRGQASLRLVSSAARAIAAYPLPLGQGFTLSPGLGAGIDVTRVTPAVNGAVPAFWASDPLLVSQLALEQKWGALLLSGYGGVEWDLVASRYSITRSAGEETVWSPSRVRPCAGVSFGYSF